MNLLISLYKNMSIKLKIFLTGTTVIILFLIINFFYIIPVMRSSIIEQKKLKLKEIVETQYSIIQSFNRQSRNGEMSVEEAKNISIHLTNNVRFGSEGKDYIWINDFKPKMIMHPYLPKLNGRDLSNYADPNGKLMFVEFVKICQQYGEGYVNYMWQWKDQKDKIVPKISFVKSFNPWGWIIGTGVYIQDIEKEIMSFQINLTVIYVIITVLMFFLILFISRDIANPVIEVTSTFKKLSESGGDLTKRLIVNSKNEIGEFSRYFNIFIEKLNNIIYQIKTSAVVLTDSSKMISDDNRDLSKRTSDQFSSLKELSSSIREIADGVRISVENSHEASILSEKNIRLAENGGNIVTELIDSIQEINQYSKKIGEIFGVINDIAYKSNLLALNAAIEASHAGKHGRGFSIVANEVRDLAQRSGDAAKEIEALISDTIDKIEKVTVLSNKSGESLDNINLSSEHVYKIVKDVSLANKEQENLIIRFNNAINKMEAITDENTSLVEKTSIASKDLDNHAVDLKKLVNEFVIENKDD
ncbi:MAG: cache domain-containing protein [Spirochaetota bacterium]|nr:cache domain-containing protein [Spirochaetota bacterium]